MVTPPDPGPPPTTGPNLPFQAFDFCPSCGDRLRAPLPKPVLRCVGCGFVFFFNPAVAAGAFLHHPTRGLLFLRRARDPARGKLGVPGGFIDYHETAEAGLQREIYEETALRIHTLNFLCSQPNSYEFLDITYPVLDLFFTGSIPSDAVARPLDDVDSLCWLQPHEVAPSELAFPSLRAAWQVYRGP
jgi:ADP-ribose pyrophosphatase YjhB (NUDIX family)